MKNWLGMLLYYHYIHIYYVLFSVYKFGAREKWSNPWLQKFGTWPEKGSPPLVYDDILELKAYAITSWIYLIFYTV